MIGQLCQSNPLAVHARPPCCGGRRRCRLPHSSSIRLLLALVSFCAFAIQAPAAPAEQNWPQWRGPLATGVAPAADPPLTWGENQNIKWKVKIPGRGTSTPVVWDNFVFIQTAVPTGKQGAPASADPAPPPQQGRRGGRGGGGSKPAEAYRFVLLCLDRGTGKTLWEQTAREEVPHEGHHPTEGNFAPNSPATDGKHVLAYFGSRGLYCYDMAGKLQWDRDFGDQHMLLGFGEGSSPALSGNTVVVNWDTEDESFIAALDKNTGKVLWKTPRQERSSWATPLIVEHEGKRQVVTAATSKVRGYDLATGALIWECAGLTRNVIPSPVAADGVVYVTSGYQGNSVMAIRLGRTGDLTGTDAVVWTARKGTPYVPSPLLYDGRLYLFSTNSEVLSVFDARTGRPLVETKRVEGLQGVYASPVAAGGRIYLVGRNGATAVLKPADQLEILATNTLNEKFDASPAAAGNELFVRGQEYLYCVAGK